MATKTHTHSIYWLVHLLTNIFHEVCTFCFISSLIFLNDILLFSNSILTFLFSPFFRTGETIYVIQLWRMTTTEVLQISMESAENTCLTVDRTILLHASEQGETGRNIERKSIPEPSVVLESMVEQMRPSACEAYKLIQRDKYR